MPGDWTKNESHKLTLPESFSFIPQMAERYKSDGIKMKILNPPPLSLTSRRAIGFIFAITVINFPSSDPAHQTTDSQAKTLLHISG